MRRSVWYSWTTLTLTAALAACAGSESLEPSSTLEFSTPTAAIAAAAPATQDVAVTSVIQDNVSYQILSDGSGAYQNSSTLISRIDGSLGDWTLDSYAPARGTRKVYLSFSRAIENSGPGGGPTQSIPSGSYRFHLISKCHLNGKNFLTIPKDSTVQCPMRFGQIQINNVMYGITMNPGTTSNGTSWPETNYANVRCNAASVGNCTNWTITPSGLGPDGLPANVGALNKDVTAKGNTTVVKLGDYWFSFRIEISNP